MCGAGGYTPNVLQPTEAYCTNPGLGSILHLQRRSTSDVVSVLYYREEELWVKNGRSNLAYNCDFHGNYRVLLHAAKLRHGTDFPSEGRHAEDFFSPEKSDGFGRV
jgi:hypothetical protein